MDGILIVDKPKGFTSFQVIARLRKISGIKRIGHGGTLDPMATGVLPIFFGRTTRICDILPDEKKIYKAEITLGLTTDTEDITGEVISRYEGEMPSLDEIKRVLSSFMGEYLQAVPMYSAVSVSGKRLYELAREGAVLPDRPKRTVEIFDISLDSYSENILNITVSCKRGTYIRTLASDIGKALGTGATLSALRRTYSASFSIEDAVTEEEIQSPSDIKKHLLPTSKAFEILPFVKLDEKQTKMFLNGVTLDSARILSAGEKGLCRVLSYEGEFLGIARDEGNELKIIKVLKG